MADLDISVNDSIAVAEVAGPTITLVTCFRYYIEHRNTSGTIQARIEDIVESFNFEYNRIGGCGSFDMTLSKSFEGTPRFSSDDDIRLYVKTSIGGSYSLYYRGYVESFAPRVNDSEKWSIRGAGYIGQLGRLVVTTTYENMAVEDVVADILDNYVVGQLGIDVTYSSSDISSSGLVVNSIAFDDTVADAMQKLADLVGQIEWGVDENAQFFFKQRSNDTAVTLFLGNDIAEYEVLDDYENIANRIEIRGGRNTNGSIYSYTVNNSPSQTAFGLRAKIYNNASIKNDTDANRYGQAILQESSNVTRRAKAVLTTRGTNFHASKPLGVVQVPNLSAGFSRTIFGLGFYGVPKYGGLDTFQVSSINYRLEERSSGFEIEMDLGSPRPELFTPIARLDFGLEQVRAR